MELTYTLDELPAVVPRVLRRYGPRRVFALEGELGAGKTTLVAEMCRHLGVTEAVSSPTFGIVKEYEAGESVIYHLDCYRLNSVEEAIDAGIEELIESAEAHVFVEWPAVIEPLLPDDVVFLRLRHDPNDGGRRHLLISTDEP